MKRSWIWIALAASLGINVGILATLAVQGVQEEEPARERSREPSPEARTGPIADRLGLEGKSREQFMKLQQSLFEGMQGHREELDSLRQEVSKELQGADPKPERLDRLIEDMATVNSSMEQEFVETVLATRELLDEDQEKMYVQFLARMRGQGGQRGRQMSPQQQQMMRQQQMSPQQQQKMRQQQMQPGMQNRPQGMPRDRRRQGRAEDENEDEDNGG